MFSAVPTLIFDHASLDRSAEFVVGYAGRTVQDQRGRDGVREPGDEFVVELRGSGRHRVGAADRDGERVDAGGGHESARLLGIGADSGSVYAVLATDLAEFGLQPQALGVGPVGRGAGGGDILGIAAARRRRTSPSRSRSRKSAARRSSSSSVTWSRCRPTGTRAPSATAAVAEASGASEPPWKRTAFSLIWQMTGHSGGLGAHDDRLGVLQCDHVERADATAVGAGGADEFGGGDQGHGWRQPFLS